MTRLFARIRPYSLIIILVVAAILRFNHINQPFVDYISWRQTSTAMMAENFYRRNWNILYPEVSWDGPGPSYNGREFQTISYLAALLYVVVGQHDWVGRSLAILFGLWGIFALYQLVRRVWDEKHAIAAATMMALLPGSIFFERSFLPDPAMVSLVVTSFWILVVYCQSQHFRYLLLAAAIGTWGFLTKITGLIVGIPMLYAMWALCDRNWLFRAKRLATITAVTVGAFVPIVAYYLWARHLSLTYPPYHFAGGGNWVWDSGLQAWLDKKYFLPGLIWVFDTWLWTKPIIFLVALGLVLRPPQFSNSERKAPWLFHIWLLMGVLYYIIGAKELVPNAWNFHILNPAAAVLAGRALLAIASQVGKLTRSSLAPLATIAVILFLVGAIGQKSLQFVYDPPEYWKITDSYKMGLALRQVSKLGDLVVTIPNDLGTPIAIYYSQRRGWVFPPASTENLDWTKLPEDESRAIEIFEDLRDKGADWLGIGQQQGRNLWKNHQTFIQHVDRTCEFHSKSKDWLIYRILTPEELKQRSSVKSQT